MDVTLEKLPLAEMQKIEPAITKDVFAVLSLEASVNSRESMGGTAPKRVREQIAILAGEAQMTMRLMLAFVLVFSLAGCGVKNDLVLPDGSKNAKGQKDPSKPPIPIGE